MGQVHYSIINRSSTTSDTWDISIVPEEEVGFLEDGRPYQAFALHENVSSISDSAFLDPGTYSLAVFCQNLIEDCQFSLDLSVLE